MGTEGKGGGMPLLMLRVYLYLTLPLWCSLQNNNISGSQGGMFTSPSGVRGELIKAWLAMGRERSGLELSITGLD
jgi:hypothetical protein